MEFYKDHYLLRNTMPNQWSTAKQLGLAASTLNAMERRGLIEVNRKCAPMKYKPIVKDGAMQTILDLVKDYDNTYRVHLVYETRCIETIIKQPDGNWRCYFNRDIELNDTICSNVKYLSVYKDGEGIGGPDVKYENN